MVSIVMTAVDPEGKQQRRNLNTSYFTKEEVADMCAKFKQHIRDGKSKSEFDTKPYKKQISKATTITSDNASVSSSDVEAPMFPHKHIDSIEIDDSLGGSSWCVIGSTKSGKSTLVNHIEEHFYKKHITMLMTLSSTNAIYKQYHKKGVVVEGFQPEMIEEAILINKKTDCKYDFLFITDDLSIDGKNSEMMTRLLCVARNQNISAIISGQKATMLSATGRSNCNYICLFYQNADSEIEFTIKSFLRSYMPRDFKLIDCIKYYRQATEGHHFFLIDTLNNKCFLSKL